MHAIHPKKDSEVNYSKTLNLKFGKALKGYENVMYDGKACNSLVSLYKEPGSLCFTLSFLVF